jgi:hypothetical protein
MIGRTLVITGRDTDGNLTFHDAGHNVIRDRAISSHRLAQLGESVATSRNGLVCFDGLYLDESDVSVLINADAKWVAADATDMTRPEWRIT